MRTRTLFVAILVLGIGGLTGPRPAAAQTPPVRVVLSGTAAPAGGNYSSFVNPYLNESGQVGFIANLTGGSATSGIFVGAPGSIQAAALQGSPAPAGGNYSSFSGISFLLNGSGQVGFTATLTGGSSTSGIFVGAPGSVLAVALKGTAAPAGGNYNNFDRPVLNGSGQVGFLASLTGGSSTLGLFVGAPGSVQAAALRGTAAPAGGNYNVFSNSVLNGSGKIAFTGFLTGGSSTSGVFVGAPGSIQAAALQGTAAPAGGNYSNFNDPVLNASGQVGFVGLLTGGSSDSGIFVGAPGAIQVAALQGAAAPAGGNYDLFSNPPVLNGSGQVAFHAQLTGGSSASGLFVGAPGAVQAAALSGTAAPSGGTFVSFSDPVMNGSGQVAFRAFLTGAGVTAANNFGIYAGSVGALEKVVREGDQVDVDPGIGIDLRIVADNGIIFPPTLRSGGQDGRGVSLTDSGFITYQLQFTDGSFGVFVSQITPTPEPASAGLIAAAGLAMVGWLKRRKNRRAAQICSNNSTPERAAMD